MSLKKKYHKSPTSKRTESKDPCKNFHGGNQYSSLAWLQVSPEAPNMRRDIFALISNSKQGLTCEEIENALKVKHQTCSARITELKTLKLIHEDGGRMTTSGRRAAVYKATSQAMRKAA